MTNDVKTRVLTPYVMICRLQKSFFCKNQKIINFASYISWQMMSKLEFWHHMSWSVGCKNRFFCKKSKNYQFWKAYIMTNGVKSRVLTPYVMICRLQNRFFAKNQKNINFARHISWQMMSKVEFWHHMSWSVGCKNRFFAKIKKLLILQVIYHDKWCQNSSFDTICHDL